MKRYLYLILFTISFFTFAQDDSEILQEVTGFIDYTIDENNRKNCKLPTITVDDKLYKVMINPKYIIDEKIKSGTKLSIRGIIKESQWQNDKSLTLFAKEIIYNDKTIIIEQSKLNNKFNPKNTKDKSKKFKK